MIEMIGLIRHGVTEWNSQSRVQGQVDTDLTDEGREQARLLGTRLSEEQWDGIFSSNLIRAQETAEMIAFHSHIPIIGLDKRLRERNFGQIEGTTEAERIEKFGPHWRQLDLSIETNEQLFQRWCSFEKMISNTYPYGYRLLVVTHGNYIVELLKQLQLEKEEFLQNASLTVIKKENQVWNLQMYNCVSHLSGYPS
jgi:probable phosphoglycerate mutase